LNTKSILIVDTYYPAFLHSICADQAHLNGYDDIHEELMSYSFGTSDAYSSGLKKLDWIANEVVPNYHLIQKAWGHEHSRHLWASLDRVPPSYIASVPLVRDIWSQLPTLHRMLEHQILTIDPTVVYFQDLNFTSPGLLTRLRKQGRLVVGQIASPLPPPSRLRMFDMILSSLPNQIEQIRSAGVVSEFLPIAFDQRVLQRVPQPDERDIPVSFVGGISKFHDTTIPLLDEVHAKCPELQIFGYGAETLKHHPNLGNIHNGERWGLNMYKTLMRSKATLNRHISISGEYANNMRLFEATGSGTLLITDYKKNLHEYFDIGTEVLAYKSISEAADMAMWASNNPIKADAIAKRGQQRTLNDHTYDARMVQLDRILRNFM
jgi:spore maturation protein CgeB